MKNKLLHINIIALLFGLSITVNCFAQEFELKNYRTRFNLNTYKQSDNTRLLEVKFVATNKKNRRDKLPIYEADIDFYNVLNEEEVKLGTSKTNKQGISLLTIPADQSYLIDEEGFINLRAVFKGMDGMKSKEDEIAVKDISLELYLTEIDKIRTVVFKAYTSDSLKNKIPVEEIDVVFSVGALLSKMTIKEETIRHGEYKFEFPNNLHGDKDGNIDVFASILDHDDFGNVVQSKKINWGNLIKQETKKRNTLWSEIAPIWMYVVLTILITGVWANYIYSFINLLKIKKEGKELEFKKSKIT